MATTTTETIIDGFRYDTETGELVGPVVDPGFTVDTDDKAAWVMKRFLEIDSAIEAVDSTEDVILAKAVLANVAKIKANLTARRQSLEFRFLSELAAYCGANLPKGLKTWRCIYGEGSLRSVPAALKVKDPEAALGWAERHCVGAVKVTKAFLISAVPSGEKARIMAEFAEGGPIGSALVDAFEYSPASEKFTVKTNAGKDTATDQGE